MEVKREYIPEKLEANIREYRKKHHTNSPLLILIDPFSFEALFHSNSASQSCESFGNHPTFQGINIQCIESCDEFMVIQSLFPNDVRRDSWYQLEQRQKAEVEMLDFSLYRSNSKGKWKKED